MNYEIPTEEVERIKLNDNGVIIKKNDQILFYYNISFLEIESAPESTYLEWKLMNVQCITFTVVSEKHSFKNIILLKVLESIARIKNVKEIRCGLFNTKISEKTMNRYGFFTNNPESFRYTKKLN